MEKEKIENNPVVKEVTNIFEKNGFFSNRFCLVGGAVVDILEGRKPKDYDFIGIVLNDDIFSSLIKSGYEFKYSTRTADTFYKEDIELQFLKTELKDFDFTISQSTFSLKKKELVLDKKSFQTKTLIPVNFTSRRNVLNSLSRIPHWKKKGYSIPDITYLSLLGVVGTKTNLNS